MAERSANDLGLWSENTLESHWELFQQPQRALDHIFRVLTQTEASCTVLQSDPWAPSDVLQAQTPAGTEQRPER